MVSRDIELIKRQNMTYPLDAAPQVDILHRLANAGLVGGVLMGLGIFLLGWHMRELFALPYDYHLLAIVLPVACYIVSHRRWA